MNNAAIIAGIDAEIAKLEKARALLSGPLNIQSGRKVGRPKKTVAKAGRRTLSSDARARIAAAQRARWAKAKKGKKSNLSAKTTAKTS